MFIKHSTAKFAAIKWDEVKERYPIFSKRIATNVIPIDPLEFLYLRNESVHCEEHYGANENGDGFGLPEMRSRYHTFIGARSTADHKDDLNIGEVFDSTFLEPLFAKVSGKAEDVFSGGGLIENLIGVSYKKVEDLEKKGVLQKPFIQNILDEKITDTSMGAMVTYTMCLPPVTKIYTIDGWKRIKDIKVGNQVLTHKGKFRKVTRLFKNKPNGFIRIYFKTGKKISSTNSKRWKNTYGKHEQCETLLLTPEHPVLTSSGWKEAKDITTDDKIVILSRGCKVCGTELSFYNKSEFCSRRCVSKNTMSDLETKKRVSGGVSKKRKGKTYEEIFGDEKAQKLRIKRELQWNNYTPEQRTSIQKKLSESLRRYLNTPEGKDNIQKAAKRSWIGESKEKHLKFLREHPEIFKASPSKLQKDFYDCLKILGLEPKINWFVNLPMEQSKQLNQKVFYLDIAFPELMIDVEVDGDYWHRKTGDKDRLRDNILSSMGWSVLRIKEMDLLKNKVSCLDKVQRLVMNHTGSYKFSSFEVVKVEKSAASYNAVYNLAVEEDESYIAKGVVVHNCSICDHIAYDEKQYCEHILGGKNREIVIASGEKKKVWERCYGVTWFEDAVIVPLELGGQAGGAGADTDAKIQNIITSGNHWEERIDDVYRLIVKLGSKTEVETFEEILKMIVP